MTRRRDEVACIREVFLKPRKEYSITTMARLVNSDTARITAEIEKEWIQARTEYRIPRQEVLTRALERWPLETIYEALGSDAERILPPLLKPEELRLFIPAYVARAIEYMAAIDGKQTRESLYQLLREYATDIRVAHPEIDEHIAGFAEALFYPNKPWPKA